MTKAQQVLALIKQQKVMPLYYHDSAAISMQAAWALYAGGIRLIEYTNRGANALKNFNELRKLVDAEMKDLQLGVGTIKSADDAKKFIAAGADFVVAPIVNPEVADVVHQNKLLWIPGCFTNTEIYTAETSGASLLKIFPGGVGGPSYITALKEIFPNLDFMPTGGVEPTVASIHGWLKAGVVAVGMGSKMVSKEILDNGQFEKLTETAKSVLKIISEYRG